MQLIRNNDGLLSMRNNLVLQRLIILKFTGSANGCQVALAAFPRIIRHVGLLDCPECISEAGGFGSTAYNWPGTGCVPATAPPRPADSDPLTARNRAAAACIHFFKCNSRQMLFGAREPARILP